MKLNVVCLALLASACGSSPSHAPQVPEAFHAELEALRHMAARHGGTVVACPVPGVQEGAEVAQEPQGDPWWPVREGWVLGLAQAERGDRIPGGRRVVWHAEAPGGLTACELVALESATVIVRPVRSDGSSAPVEDGEGHRGSVSGCSSVLADAELQPDGTLRHRVDVRDGGCRLRSHWPAELLGGEETDMPSIRVLELTDLQAGEQRTVELVVDRTGMSGGSRGSRGALSRATSLLGIEPQRERPWRRADMARWLKSASVRMELSPEAREVLRARADALDEEEADMREHFRALDRLGNSPESRNAVMDEHLDLMKAWYTSRRAHRDLLATDASDDDKARSAEALEATERELCDWLEDPGRRAVFGVPEPCEQGPEEVVAEP